MQTSSVQYYQEVRPTTTELLLTVGKLRYRWLEQALRIPDTERSRADGRTHGIAISATGKIIVFHQADPAVLIFNQEGLLEDAWGDAFPGAHGLTVVQESNEEFLWLADSKTGQVVKTTLQGRTVLTIERPPLAIYATRKYAPTWVAVHEERHGGNGDIWVTDGYGSSMIHSYDQQGTYLGSIDGTEGAAGAFACPHSIFIDTRKPEAELYIADRGNRRVQVYDLEGNYKRVFGTDFLTSPCAFAISGEQLIIPELRARIALLDGADQLIGYLGDNESVCDLQGWPNHPAALIEAGKFNSPHGIAADAQGNIYVVEWIIGGRITKLEKVAGD
ncbi:MAG: hypothetical protein KF832_21230 [Caldilineaceae bacterium]|nr:hypothetical protein [Caldilineaceae bacterium]